MGVDTLLNATQSGIDVRRGKPLLIHTHRLFSSNSENQHTKLGNRLGE